jgi:hypothetical protein
MPLSRRDVRPCGGRARRCRVGRRLCRRPGVHSTQPDTCPDTPSPALCEPSFRAGSSAPGAGSAHAHPARISLFGSAVSKTAFNRARAFRAHFVTGTEQQPAVHPRPAELHTALALLMLHRRADVGEHLVAKHHRWKWLCRHRHNHLHGLAQWRLRRPRESARVGVRFDVLARDPLGGVRRRPVLRGHPPAHSV